MKLRIILFVLALLAFVSASSGGYLYYTSLKKSAFKEGERLTIARTKSTRNRVSYLLSENLKSVKALAGLYELKHVLVNPNEKTLSNSSYLLDHFRKALEANVCYLMDSEGVTIASSNRNELKSFVGKNYSFRPYFKNAMQGIPSVYMALGVTSGKRGVYYSHPVYLENLTNPAGVIVLKSSVESLELELKELQDQHESITLITDPNGVIFMSSQKEWLYRTLWSISDEKIIEILESRQFGNSPLEWIGLEGKNQNHAVSKSGNKYLLHRAEIDSYQGWSVVHLTSLDSISKGIYDPLIKTTGSITFFLCLFIGISVLILYRNASSEIRHRKKTEQALKASEANYRAIFDAANDAVFIHDLKSGQILDVNKKMCDMYGYSANEARVISVEELSAGFSPYRQDDALKWIKKAAQGKPQLFEWHAKNKAGGLFWVEVNLKRAIIGGKDRLLAVVRDISERKRAEEEKRDSEERFNSFMKHLPALAFMKDINGRYIYLNDACKKFYNADPAQRIGKTDMELFSEEDAKQIRENDKRVIRQGKVLDSIETVKVGKELQYHHISKFPILKDGTSSIIAGIAIDITNRIKAEKDKERLEEQLQRAQKMKALGLLAGGVAHDLNNVLSGIVSYPELLLIDLPENSPLRAPILTIQESGLKASAIVQDLLTLARRGIIVTEVIDLNDIILDYLRSPEYKKLQSYHPSVRIETNFSAKLSIVIGSEVHLKKTVMNLISNAAEAQPKGGIISISTENRYIDKPISGYDQVQEGDYVVLAVQDKGIGIAAEDLSRIFEPFYTKKVMGRSGTGLGMAVVWGTVQDHNGYINIKSIEGKGTTFELYFPITRQELSQEKSNKSIEEYRGNNETILIVDDIKQQREIATNILRTLNYSVTSVSSGEEAVDYMKYNIVDMLLLDMIMDPGIDGFETYKRIVELHPGQKAIIVSGFAETGRVKEAQILGAGAYIKKPYTMENIGVAIKTELEKCNGPINQKYH